MALIRCGASKRTSKSFKLEGSSVVMNNLSIGVNTITGLSMNSGIIIEDDISSVTLDYTQTSGQTISPNILAYNRKTNASAILSEAQYRNIAINRSQYDFFILPSYNGGTYTFTVTAS